MPGISVGYRRRHPQVDFSPGILRAPDIQIGAQLIRAFAHAKKPPVPNPSTFVEQRSIDTTAVVPYSHAQFRFAVIHVSLNLARIRVPESIGECFSSKEQRLFAYNRVQFTGRSLCARPKLYWVREC
jgi:hypothetical protein